MATFFDLTPDTFAVLRVPAAEAAVALLVGFGVAWWLRRRGRAWGATFAVALTMVIFCHAANTAFGAFSPQMSSRPLADAINAAWHPQDALAVYGEFEAECSVGFYTDRQALVYNGRYNGLAYGSRYPDAPQVFLTDETFSAVWRGPRRVFLVVPESQQAAAQARLPADQTWILAESGGKTVFVNRPVRPGQLSLAAQRKVALAGPRP
jgi:hypothetical protein